MTAIRPGASPESVAAVAGDLTSHITATVDAHAIGAVTGLQGALGSAAGIGPIVCVGDSITTGNPATGVSYPSWLAASTGLDITNSGVSGNHLHDVSDRLPALFSLNPSKLVVLCGTNDITSGDTLVQLAAYTEVITATCRAAGVPLAYLAVLPTATHAPRIAYNNWLARHCRANSLEFIDTFTPFANSDGTPKTGYLYDGLHPSALGYKVLADTVAAKLTYPTVNQPWKLPGETLLYANGDFVLDTNSDGLADGLTVSTGGATVTKTLVAHEVAGNWQRLSGTGGATSAYWSAYCDTAITAGDVIELAVDVKSGVSDIPGQHWRVLAKWSDTTTVRLMDNSYVGAVVPYRFRIVATVPTGVTSIRLYMGAWAVAGQAFDYSFGRLAIRKVGA